MQVAGAGFKHEHVRDWLSSRKASTRMRAAIRAQPYTVCDGLPEEQTAQLFVLNVIKYYL